MAKITGIGGVFFKSTGDHKKLSEWTPRTLVFSSRIGAGRS